MKLNAIMKKKATLELLETLFHDLENEERYTVTKTIWYDTDRPLLDEDGNQKTKTDGTLRWEQDYKTVDKNPEDYSDEEKAKLDAIDEVKKVLEKLI